MPAAENAFKVLMPLALIWHWAVVWAVCKSSQQKLLNTKIERPGQIDEIK